MTRFLKLRMIWAILKGRTVVYNAKLSPKGLILRTDKACVISNTFTKFGIKNHLDKIIMGDYDES